MEDRIITELNAELGCDIENLSKSISLVEKYANQLNVIEEKVILICATFEQHLNIIYRNIIQMLFKNNWFVDVILKIIYKLNHLVDASK